jgi:hypothetical protein
MQAILCDSCGKQVKDPFRGVNYVTVLDKALCTGCKFDFDNRLTKAMFSRKRYVFLEQKKILSDTLQKICR